MSLPSVLCSPRVGVALRTFWPPVLVCASFTLEETGSGAAGLPEAPGGLAVGGRLWPPGAGLGAGILPGAHCASTSPAHTSAPCEGKTPHPGQARIA